MKNATKNYRFNQFRTTDLRGSMIIEVEKPETPFYEILLEWLNETDDSVQVIALSEDLGDEPAHSE